MKRRAILAVTTWVGTALAAPASLAASDQARVVILSGPQRTYRQAAAALQETLERSGHECLFVLLPGRGDESARERAVSRLAAAKPTVIAAAGATATSLALATVPDTPVVFFMVPNALDARFMADGDPDRTRVTGVAADVSPSERIDWIVRLAPSNGNVGVLHTRRTARTVEALRRAAAQRGLTVSPIEADRDEFPKAIDALNDRGCTGVLMIPDAKVYNSITVQRLLLWGIRRKKPVWAFSASIVKAGALAGQYSTGEAVGRQAAELIQEVIDGTPPSEIPLQYPRQVGRAVNERSAKMLGVALSETILGGETVQFGERP